MELEFKPLRPEYLELISPPDMMKSDLGMMLSPEYKDALMQGQSISLWRGNRCIAAVGMVPVYPQRKSIAWALVSKDVGSGLIKLTRAIKKFMDNEPTPRIEFFVLEGFKEGHKWAKMLGFKCETPGGMEKHSPLGETEYLYSRIK